MFFNLIPMCSIIIMWNKSAVDFEHAVVTLLNINFEICFSLSLSLWQIVTN